MNLVQFAAVPADWDRRIAGYATKTLFHETAWHKHLLECNPGSRMVYYSLMDGDTLAGYFCVHRLRKAMLSIFGSPMPGTGSNYMGPIVASDAPQREVVSAILRECRRSRIAHLEIASDWLSAEVMKECGFVVGEDMTHVVPLPDSEDAAWKGLHSTCRNRVRKAEGMGLTIEFSTDPRVAATTYFEQFIEVYGKQKMTAPYTVARPLSLVSCLLPASRLVAVIVKHEGEAVASGLFPYDEGCIYYWGGASWLSAHALCPNELLHWAVIRFAIAHGIPRYDMCGGGSQFKRKFGGDDVPHLRYHRSFIPFMAQGRRLYAKWHFGRLRLAGFLKNPFGARRTRIG